MERKILITSRLPEIGKYVYIIDEKGEKFKYRLNEDNSWSMHPDESENYINRNGKSSYETRKVINNNYQLLFWVDEITEFVNNKQPFLLQYHLSRRCDEGFGNMRLVFANTEEEAIEILIDKMSYKYTDALDCRMVIPDNIKCLNI